MGNPPKRKLVFLWSYLEWGGAQIYLIAIMKEAMRQWDVTVALPKASSPEILAYLRQAGVDYEFLTHHLDIGPAHK